MTIRDRDMNTRLENLEACAEHAPDGMYKIAGELSRLIDDTVDRFITDVRYISPLHADNSDGARNLEVDLYRYVLDSNRDNGLAQTIFAMSEGFGQSATGPAGDRVIEQATRDRDQLQKLGMLPEATQHEWEAAAVLADQKRDDKDLRESINQEGAEAVRLADEQRDADALQSRASSAMEEVRSVMHPDTLPSEALAKAFGPPPQAPAAALAKAFGPPPQAPAAALATMQSVPPRPMLTSADLQKLTAIWHWLDRIRRERTADKPSMEVYFGHSNGSLKAHDDDAVGILEAIESHLLTVVARMGVTLKAEEPGK